MPGPTAEYSKLLLKYRAGKFPTVKPNVLLVVLDAVRADHTSAYGYDRPTTPRLEEVAADGYRFDNAFAAAPWTPPSHGSLFAGVHPSTHGFLDGSMPYTPPHPPLAECLRKEGYLTVGTVQNSKIGEKTGMARGFSEYFDLTRLPFVPRSVDELRKYYLNLLPGYLQVVRRSVGAKRKPAEYLTSEYLRAQIRGREGPFFSFINILSAHSKYAPPKPYDDRFAWVKRAGVDDRTVEELADRGGYRFVAGELDPSDDEWATVKDRYDGEIAFADRILGRLLDALQEAGLYEETIVIVTADHGEHFGEHGRAYHQFSLFDELLHVPLVVKPAHGSAMEHPKKGLVSLVDVYPTVLAAAGLDVPKTVDGVNLFDADERDAIFAEYGEPKTAVSALESNTESPVDESLLDELNHPLQCVRTRDQKYVRVHGGEDRVYGVGPGDPKDTLAHQGEDEELAARLSDTLGTNLQVEKAEPDDPAVRENLRALGYR